MSEILTSTSLITGLQKLPLLSLYIHIPWCIKKCPYCDFNSHAAPSDLPEEQYIEALLADLKTDLSYVQGRQLSSIFIGGGTPSLFSPSSLKELLERCSEIIEFAEDIEITMEANPGTFEQEKFTDFRLSGINRLSIGIQSFNADYLKKLGRVHDDNEALLAPEIALKAGFDNFNLDLMFGLPGQSISDALTDLRIAAEFNPSHLSWYQLTIEPNTVFHRRPPPLPEATIIDDMQDSGINFLKDKNFHRYEVSAFAKANKESLHNLNYWKFGDYLGIGAGAHGKISQPRQNRIIRATKRRQPESYLNPEKVFTAGTSSISRQDLALEFMMNALRLTNGVSYQLFEERTGLSIEELHLPIESLQNKGLLEKDALSTTNKGFNLLNNVLHAFMN